MSKVDYQNKVLPVISTTVLL